MYLWWIWFTKKNDETETTEKKTTENSEMTKTETECYIWSDIPHKHAKNEGCINTDLNTDQAASVCLLHAILCH